MYHHRAKSARDHANRGMRQTQYPSIRPNLGQEEPVSLLTSCVEKASWGELTESYREVWRTRPQPGLTRSNVVGRGRGAFEGGAEQTVWGRIELKRQVMLARIKHTLAIDLARATRTQEEMMISSKPNTVEIADSLLTESSTRLST